MAKKAKAKKQPIAVETAVRRIASKVFELNRRMASVEARVVALEQLNAEQRFVAVPPSELPRPSGQQKLPSESED